MGNDYTQYVKPQSEDAMAQLARLAQEQLEAEQEVENGEEALKKAKERLRVVSETAIPELMDQLGLTEFKTSTGLKIKVSEKIRASISAASKSAAFQWLRDNRHAAIIKRELRMEFGMGEDEIAEKALVLLRGNEEFSVVDDSSVHNQTLTKFVSDMLKEGKPLPEDLFNVHRQRFTKVKV